MLARLKSPDNFEKQARHFRSALVLPGKSEGFRKAEKALQIALEARQTVDARKNKMLGRSGTPPEPDEVEALNAELRPLLTAESAARSEYLQHRNNYGDVAKTALAGAAAELYAAVQGKLDELDEMLSVAGDLHGQILANGIDLPFPIISGATKLRSGLVGTTRKIVGSWRR